MKQLGTAALMYTQDYDGTYCGATQSYPSHRFSDAAPWQFIFEPYVKNWQIFLCPSAESPDMMESLITGEEIPMISWANEGYGLNQCFGYKSMVVKESQLDAPAETIYIAEVEMYATHPFWWTYGDGYYLLQPRHNEGLNLAFADGHAKWLRLEDAKDYDRWCFEDAPGWMGTRCLQIGWTP